MTADLPYVVSLFYTPQPGFQYEARIHRGGELEYVAGGMTEEAAELAAREWIACEGRLRRAENMYVRSFIVRARSQDVVKCS